MSRVRENAQVLRSEALAILQGGVRALLERTLGHVEIAGSVALDLMVVPDIDLYVRLEEDEASRMLGLLPDLAAQLRAQGYTLAKLTFSNEHSIPDPRFPTSPGLYSGLTFVSGNSGSVWKMDLWGWDQRFYNLRHTQHQELQQSVQGADRDLILQLKEAKGYGSAFFSVDVYDFALSGKGNSLEAFAGFLLERKGSK